MWLPLLFSVRHPRIKWLNLSSVCTKWLAPGFPYTSPGFPGSQVASPAPWAPSRPSNYSPLARTYRCCVGRDHIFLICVCQLLQMIKRCRIDYNISVLLKPDHFLLLHHIYIFSWSKLITIMAANNCDVILHNVVGAAASTDIPFHNQVLNGPLPHPQPPTPRPPLPSVCASSRPQRPTTAAQCRGSMSVGRAGGGLPWETAALSTSERSRPSRRRRPRPPQRRRRCGRR